MKVKELIKEKEKIEIDKKKGLVIEHIIELENKIKSVKKQLIKAESKLGDFLEKDLDKISIEIVHSFFSEDCTQVKDDDDDDEEED